MTDERQTWWVPGPEPPSASTGAPVAPVVTMTGLYGTGVSVIARRVAEELAVPFLDRGVLRGVAERLGVPEDALERLDPHSEQLPRGPVRRWFDGLGAMSPGDSPAGSRETYQGRYRSATEDFLAQATLHGGVVVGRGGMVVLRGVPGVLHVRLDGPPGAREEQAMRMFGFDRRTAERRREVNDLARIDYVRREYGVDPEDPDLYDLRLRTTTLDWVTCVDVVVRAARSRAAEAGGDRAAPTGSEDA